MSKNIKVKIYFKANKDKHVTVKLNERRDVEKLAALVQSEIFRSNYLADLDYKDKSGLVFKLNGNKIHTAELLNMLSSALNGNDYKASEEPKKKKKHKKDKKHKDIDLDFSFLKSSKIETIKDDDDEDVVIVHRI